MNNILRKGAFVLGALLLADGLLMTLIANFNIGIVPVYGLGAVLMLYSVFYEKIKWRKLVTGVLALGLSVVLIFGSFLAIFGSNDNADYTEQTVIVLGCGIRGERVSVGLAKRLNKAYEYHLKNPDATIIVAGGQGPQEDIPEALAMKRYLVDKGVPEEKIIMEDKSTSTKENFKFSHDIIVEKGLSAASVVFVTNAYHVYRASNYAKDAEITLASHLGTDIIWYTIPMNYLREMMAVVKMWVFDDVLPAVKEALS